MAVIVETGAIVANANSYASLSEADTYHENMGNTAWEGFTDDQKEAALIRGTLMIESRYEGRWYGYKTNNNQGVMQMLAWPRKDNDTQPTQDDPTVDADPEALTDSDGIMIGVNSVPMQVKYACMEAAFMHASGDPLIANIVSREDYIQRQQVESLSQTFFFKAPAENRFPFIDQLLGKVAEVGGEDINMIIGLTDAEKEVLSGENATEQWFDSLGA